MKSSITLLLVLFAFSVTSLGQVSGYDLKTFKYRTEGYRLLRLDADLKTSGGLGKKDSANDAFNAAFNTNNQLYYEKGFNLEKRQHISTLTSHIDASFTKNKTNPNNSISSFITYTQDDWFYRDKFFFKTGLSLTASAQSQKNGKDASLQKSSGSYAGIFASGAVGKGRLEYITDAQTALFIIEALQKAGKIKTGIDNTAIDKLARLITAVKNSRVQDSRRRMIYQLTQVSRFFTDNNLMEVCDPEAFAIINDNFYYGFHNELTPGTDNTWRYYRQDPRNGDNMLNAEYLPLDLWDDSYYENFDLNAFNDFMADQMWRKSGTVYYAGISFATSFAPVKTQVAAVQNKSRQHDLNSILYFVYENHLPVSLNWQRSWRVRMQLWHNRSLQKIDGHVLGDYKTNSLVTDIAYSRGYYPNNRTVVEGALGTHINTVISSNSSFPPFNLPLVAEINGGYFVNYNTAIRGNLRLSFNFGKETGFGYGLGFTLLHYFY